MNDDELWTDDEFEAAVRAYVSMLTFQEQGQAYSKADVSRSYRDGPLSARSQQSFDYRMRNISAVFAEMGRTWVQGYVPAEHVGEPSRKRIRDAIAIVEATPIPALIPVGEVETSAESATANPGLLGGNSATSVQRRVWLTAFWGFNPTDDGYLGFTRPGDRERLIREFEPGDLVLVYGADSPLTKDADRRQALGFLEIEPMPVTDRERSSEAGWARKVAMGWQDRWNHAVPARRAWRVERRIEVSHIAPDTYTPARARVIATQGVLLTESEAATALQLPVTQVDVFGESPLEAGVTGEVAMADAYTPSRGMTPTFGGRVSQYEDGENFLYMLVFDGDAAQLLGRDRYRVGGRIVVKVGYSNDPKRRRDDHNATLPPAAKTTWRLSQTSLAFTTGAHAKSAEDAMKTEFAGRFEFLGGEFFLGHPSELESAFVTAAEPAAFVIRAKSKIV